MTSALIVGLAGTELTTDERAFLKKAAPAGIILFARNCATAHQIRTLVSDAAAATGAGDFLVLIDQEGGRVQRLGPPAYDALPPAARYRDRWPDDLAAASRHAHAVARLTAANLRALGINTNCAPVLDLRVPGAHDIIADRAYAATVDEIVEIAGAAAAGYLEGGIVPVMKHIPGHGRAMADSHHTRPVVETAREALENTDFAPFKRLHHLPAAMTAHVVYTAIDHQHPASTSPAVIQSIIRKHMAFDGLLMSDDLSMQALAGPIEKRAAAVCAAGCDLALHCNGNLCEMEAAAAGAPRLAGPSLRRFRHCTAFTRHIQPFDRNEAKACLERVMEV